MKSKIRGIVACDPTGVIGKKGKLPWHCPEDIAHFSNTTWGHIMIMGYRTFLSLPAHYFDHRIGIVLTRQQPLPSQEPHLIFLSSLLELFPLLHEMGDKDCYVIGGAEIYTLFLQENLLSEFLITAFKRFYEGDTFFPLALLQTWPRQRICETHLFTLYRYFHPLEEPCM